MEDNYVFFGEKDDKKIDMITNPSDYTPKKLTDENYKRLIGIPRKK